MLAWPEIVVGARSSPLSRKQVEEIYCLLKKIYPDLLFHTRYIETFGDLHKSISLREVDKCDFFTQELDQMVLEGECRMAIHSAKDLPDPLPPGLTIGLLTKGIDPGDSLVVREGNTLPLQGLVGTSSHRREENVRCLFPFARFIDIRGNIQERLDLLEKRVVDGIVVAEAALIRLGLTHLSRLKVPGEVAPLQGRLAIVVREEDKQIQEFLQVREEESTKHL